MDNEKYGIELELIVNKFKEKMQQVKNACFIPSHANCQSPVNTPFTIFIIPSNICLIDVNKKSNQFKTLCNLHRLLFVS
jgi:hypothetical protein